MKLYFDANLEYQMQAIEAVCDLFRGQEVCRTEFSLMPLPENQPMLEGIEEELGVGNSLRLLDDAILENLRDVQLRNGLAPSGSLASGDFTVEMETGTGKTYVYLRTIFELNKRYGFTKFAIVVPSVAIKEGVYKSLQITQDHFRGVYAGTPVEFFIYDSSKLGQVRNFATSASVQIMIITVGSINRRDVNNLYKHSEKTGGEKPIDLIKATKPILIVDEPQSVDGGLNGAGKTALDAMNPLCTLRYSATHANEHHMVYRLDALDAYERRLVKQIEVAAATIEGAHNKAFVRLLSVSNKRGRISAKVELDVKASVGVTRAVMSVFDGDDLQQKTNRPVYAGFHIGAISSVKEEEFLELRFPNGEAILAIGESYGDQDALSVHRQMIRRTIREHFEKEKAFASKGIKVLSLFFIDTVDRYRRYDTEGNAVNGEYAEIFEEEYRRAAKLPTYQSLFVNHEQGVAAERVHGGYFSIDKKGGWSDTSDNNVGARESAERAYNLIMRDKEKLLSFDTPLKFIFSHSALKEGWDNPNVFQICTLREMGSERARRQTIGRGLRLCVNQEGQRVHGHEINRLTVIAKESFEQFAENLQKELEEDTGIRFGVVEVYQFAPIFVQSAEGKPQPLGVEQSRVLWDHLREAGFIDTTGKVQDSLKTALKERTLTLPESFETYNDQILAVLRKVCGRLEVKNADERITVPLRSNKKGKAIYLTDEFKSLWDRIKYLTTYRVEFDNAKLLQACISALKEGPTIPKARLQWRKADIGIGRAGVEATEKRGSATVTLHESGIEVPDLLTELQNRTQLTRRSIVAILIGSEKLEEFKANPQQFIERTADVINRCKRKALVVGIKYQTLGDQYFYAQELFVEQEVTGYLKNMLMNTKKCVYEHVVVDSSIERKFACALEKNEAIRLYAKLPGWFQIPTPLGSYNPDWAVLVERDGAPRLYLVVETKGTLNTDALRAEEAAKIRCGREHFKALAVMENPARYELARTLGDVLARY